MIVRARTNLTMSLFSAQFCSRSERIASNVNDSTNMDVMNALFQCCLLQLFAAAHLSPASFPSKCIYIFLFILSILIYNFYTSILVSSLVSGPGKTDITDVWKLADSPLTLRAEDIAYVRSYLEVSEWSIAHSMHF